MEAVRGPCLLVSPDLVVRGLSPLMDWSRPAENAAGAAVSDDVTQCDDLREHLRPVVLIDYQSVLPPGAVIAGSLADTLHAGQLGQDALDRLKTTSTRPNWNSATFCACPRKARANATSTSHAPSSSPLPQDASLLGERLCLEQQLTDDVRRPTAGNVRSTATSAPPSASAACSATSASRPPHRTTRLKRQPFCPQPICWRQNAGA